VVVGAGDIAGDSPGDMAGDSVGAVPPPQAANEAATPIAKSRPITFFCIFALLSAIC